MMRLSAYSSINTAFILHKSIKPTSEKLIANFQKHRTEFEELAALYREDVPVPRGIGGRTNMPQIKALRERIGISSIYDQGVPWLPDPYTIETAKRAKAVNNFKQCHIYCALRFEIKGGFVGTLRFGFIHKSYIHFPVPPRMEQGQLWYPMTERGVIEPGQSHEGKKSKIYNGLNIKNNS